jgi:hypothetical protein
MPANKTLTLSCIVTNTAKRDGDAVLLLFHHPPAVSEAAAVASHQQRAAAGAAFQRPMRRLLDFNRVTVPAGGSSSPQRFIVDVPRQLLLVDERGAPLEVAGVHVLEVQDGPKFEVTLPQS